MSIVHQTNWVKTCFIRFIMTSDFVMCFRRTIVWCELSSQNLRRTSFCTWICNIVVCVIVSKFLENTSSPSFCPGFHNNYITFWDIPYVSMQLPSCRRLPGKGALNGHCPVTDLIFFLNRDADATNVIWTANCLPVHRNYTRGDLYLYLRPYLAFGAITEFANCSTISSLIPF